MIDKKILTVALCGRPNSGKSTILNQILGQKITIVSSKPQTTRESIAGIFQRNDSQIVFFDTPGIFKPRNSILEKKVVKNAWNSLRSCDVLAIIFDNKFEEKQWQDLIAMLLEDVERDNSKNNNLQRIVIAIVNKADLMKMDKKIEIANFLSQYHLIKEIFFTSGKYNKGCDKLVNHLLSISKKGEWLFNDNEITDKSTNFIIAEFVREKVFQKLHKELPYVSSTQVEHFQEEVDHVKVNILLYVTKESQKKIIIGSKGSLLREIIKQSAIDIENLIDKKVILKLFIKIDPNWITRYCS
jgi:GTP-binding protein Era